MSDVRHVVENNKGELRKQFTLQGWMGELVFPDLERFKDRTEGILRARLLDKCSIQGKSDWYRLLCLACLLGAPVRTKTIVNFWNRTLEGKNFWKATIPESMFASRSSRFEKQMDQLFEELIHQEFLSQSGRGEDAELLRRVFYDFRKMHHYVFRNDLPEVFFDVLESDNHYETPIRFLKSGHTPGQRPWRGVIGQSMTAPLLFLMRELARIEIIDRSTFFPICFYMNGPARRAASSLGWLNSRALKEFDFESLVEASRAVHERMATEYPEGLDWFDLPLQYLGKRRSL